MFLFTVESSKDFHGVYDVSFLLRPLPFFFLSSLQVKKPSVDHKFLPSDPLVKSCVVKLDYRVLEKDVFLCVLLEEFHVGQKELSIHIVLLVKVPTLWLVPYNFCACLDS